MEVADKVMPNYALGELDDAANKAARSQPTELQPPASVTPAFSEGDDMNLQQLQAEVTRLTAENTALEGEPAAADPAERETTRPPARPPSLPPRPRPTAPPSRPASMPRSRAGRLLPAQKKHSVDFAMALADGEATIDFGEGDKAKKVSQREAYLLDIESRGKVVEFGEMSRHTDGASDGRPPIQEVQKGLSNQSSAAARLPPDPRPHSLTR